MKLKIVEPGWEGFNGTLGVVQFADGVSVGDVSRVEVNIISGNIRVVDFEDDSSVGALELDADVQNKPCFSQNLQTLEEILAGAPAPVAAAPVAVVEKTEKQYTQAELEKIADKSGIAGLREIGDEFGVKGTSISGLIEAILGKQAPQEPNAAPLAEGQPDVVTSEQAK